MSETSMEPGEARIVLQGQITDVGDGEIQVHVDTPDGIGALMRIPAQRGQEQWAGRRLYQGAIVTVTIRADKPVGT